MAMAMAKTRQILSKRSRGDVWCFEVSLGVSHSLCYIVISHKAVDQLNLVQGCDVGIKVMVKESRALGILGISVWKAVL